MAFGELSIGVTGLNASQRGLSVISNNISNANTTGYTRQVLNQKAALAISAGGHGMYGTGVETLNVERIRNSYLDEKMWEQSPKLGEYAIKLEKNSMLESVFGEPSDVGFTKVYSDLFNAIDSLAKAPNELDRKQALKHTIDSFTDYFNSASKSLQNQQADINSEISNKVGEINSLVYKLQNLNGQIHKTEIYGEDANNLRDERDLVLDRLSQIIDIETRFEEVTMANGGVREKLVVKVGGQTLVNDSDIRTLQVKSRENKKNPQDLDNLYDVQWSDGLNFNIESKSLSGELKGLIDMRDGAGNDTGVGYKGVPYYIKKLDNLVRGFAKAMNEVYGKQSDGTFDSTQQLFHVPLDALGNPDYSKITANDFRVSDSIEQSADNIRVNYDDVPGGENPNASKNDLLMDLLLQRDNQTMFNDCGAEEYMISMFSELGINTSEAQMYYKSQTSLTQNIEKQRLSVSQVSLDEEFLELIRYNQAYQASARIVTTMDEVYETTISRMGSW